MQGFVAKYLDGRPHSVTFARQVQQQPRFNRIHAASLRPTNYILKKISKNFGVFEVPCHRIPRHLCVSSMHSFLPQLTSYMEENLCWSSPLFYIYHNTVRDTFISGCVKHCRSVPLKFISRKLSDAWIFTLPFTNVFALEVGHTFLH